jgi:hypothetical protein
MGCVQAYYGPSAAHPCTGTLSDCSIQEQSEKVGGEKTSDLGAIEEEEEADSAVKDFYI